MNTVNFFFEISDIDFWIIMFNQRGLCHSMVYMKQENKTHITNQCHYKCIRLSLTIIFGFWEVGKKYTVFFTFIFRIMKKWFHDISHLFYLTTGKKKQPKKAFLRNIINLLGFKIIAIKCYISWSPAFAMYSLD